MGDAILCTKSRGTGILPAKLKKCDRSGLTGKPPALEWSHVGAEANTLWQAKPQWESTWGYRRQIPGVSMAGAQNCCQVFVITPQARRGPELPVGWVL